MHAPDMPVQILLPLAPVTAERTTEMHFVAMTEQMPFECAFLRELRPTCLAYVGIAVMLLSDMQVIRAAGFEHGTTLLARKGFRFLVYQLVS